MGNKNVSYVCASSCIFYQYTYLTRVQIHLTLLLEKQKNILKALYDSQYYNYKTLKCEISDFSVMTTELK